MSVFFRKLIETRWIAKDVQLCFEWIQLSIVQYFSFCNNWNRLNHQKVFIFFFYVTNSFCPSDIRWIGIFEMVDWWIFRRSRKWWHPFKNEPGATQYQQISFQNFMKHLPTLRMLKPKHFNSILKINNNFVSHICSKLTKHRKTQTTQLIRCIKFDNSYATKARTFKIIDHGKVFLFIIIIGKFNKCLYNGCWCIFGAKHSTPCYTGYPTGLWAECVEHWFILFMCVYVCAWVLCNCMHGKRCM